MNYIRKKTILTALLMIFAATVAYTQEIPVMPMLPAPPPADTVLQTMPVIPLPGNEQFNMPVMVPDSSVTYHLRIIGVPGKLNYEPYQPFSVPDTPSQIPSPEEKTKRKRSRPQ